MLLLSPSVIHATEFRRRDLLASAAEARLLASSTAGPRRLGAIAGILRWMVSGLDRVAALIPDSREQIRSKEQELAVFGVTWAAHPAYDQALALELRAARAQQQADRLASPARELVEKPAARHHSYVPGIRRALDAAFAR